MAGRHILDWHKPLICQHQTAFCDTGQHGHLALLAEVTVGAVLLDRDVVHHGGGLAVDVLATAEGVQDSLLASDPRQDAGLDGGEVGDDEAAPVGGDEGRPDQLGEDEGRLAE